MKLTRVQYNESERCWDVFVITPHPEWIGSFSTPETAVATAEAADKAVGIVGKMLSWLGDDKEVQ